MNYTKNNWRSVFAALSIVAGSILVGCDNSNSYDNRLNSDRPAGDATTMDSTQGTAVNESPMSSDNTSERPMDNTVVPGADRSTDASNATMPRKKGTRGKASLNMKNMPEIKTSVAVRDADGVYSRADVMPMYPGGEDALRRYVEDNIEYPTTAVDQGVEGDIRIAFTVNEKGKVTNVRAIDESNTEYTLKQEAIDVISKMPDWTPGTVKGKSVKTRMYMPISFQIIE